MQFFRPHCGSYLLGPNIFFSTFSWKPSTYFFSLNMRNQFAHPCKTRGKMLLVVL
jgi:hypothetical protein